MKNDNLDKARREINEIDKELRDLFLRRMNAVKSVAEYKSKNGLPILDEARETEIIKNNSVFIEDDKLRSYYVDFLKDLMTVSRRYQGELIEQSRSKLPCGAKALHINAGRGYNVFIGKRLLDKAEELLNLNRKVLIVTDDGVPKKYAETVGARCLEARIITIPQGEVSKSADCFKTLCHEMLDFGMTRTDCVVAVGGGVVGDVTGFAAASYMRGIDFYNIPTTLLSQLDSSIGGKTAVNLSGVKNIVGAFYQPSAVIIDTEVLSTLPKRHFSNGLAEAIKMSLTLDEELFELIESGNVQKNIERIILRSLSIKKEFVERDEHENGLRRVLNFGHTLGHGIEAAETHQLYHGECVAIGMIPTSSPDVQKRLITLLQKYDLPTKYNGDIEQALSFIKQDKKCDGNMINIVFVDKIGSYRLEKIDVESFCSLVREEYKK